MEEARVMDRGIARDAMPDYLYSGGILKPRANPPDRTSPRPPRLARLSSPRDRADWFAALAHVWLQSNDPANAAAAMEAPAGPENRPDNCTGPPAMSRSRWAKGRWAVKGGRAGIGAMEGSSEPAFTNATARQSSLDEDW